MGSAEDWAEFLAKRIQARQEDSIRKAEFTAMNRQIEAEEMPSLWKELLVQFHSHCKAFNDSVHPERPLIYFQISAYHFEVKPDALPEIVTGDYDYQPGTSRLPRSKARRFLLAV